MLKIMSAGPTQVRENVRLAIAREATNPDLDTDFFNFYRDTCFLLEELLHSSGRAFILGGEGILGLEAACASLTEQGDRVLVIENGIFGKGFADFVTMYGGEAVIFFGDYRKPLNPEELKKFLETDSNFKYATIVHCDTPTGVMNDISAIGSLLASYGIMSVVDSVAGMFGEPLDFDEAKIDILCGGSQKALSAPPGLSMVWVSDKAFAAMQDRKTPIASFYANILLFKDYYRNLSFPYTMPANDIAGLRQALENVREDKAIINRHETIAFATRETIKKSGLKLFLEDGFSNNVTAIEVPEGLTDVQILGRIKEKYGVLLSGCFDCLAGRIFRIGHMGENARLEDMTVTMEALDNTLRDFNFPLECNLKDEFLKYFK